MEGKIIKLISNDYTVLSNNKKYICKSRGKFRKLKISPLVGDQVVFDDINNYILEVKKRKNELVRPPVANIDQAFIITSVKHPNFSTNLLDKLIDIIEFNNIEPIIIITKLDLCNKNELKEIKKYIKYYKKIGYKIYTNKEIRKIKKEIKNSVIAVAGQTGAGKSTLLNKIDKNLNLKTGEVSTHLGRGKHTTRLVELLSTCKGLIADTPGFSSLELNINKNDISGCFKEFGYNCKYKSCTHIKDDGCDVINKVSKGKILKSRYENYLKLTKE